MKKILNTIPLFFGIAIMLVLSYGCGSKETSGIETKVAENSIFEDSIWFEYQEVSGIGTEPPFTRRDPSDVIEVDGKYYVWYTKVKDVTPGYWGTIWYAVSEDEGRSWTEKGEALGTGPEGAFDSHAVFTPNILYEQGKYYLFYTAVKPTPGNAEQAFENNSETDITAIGVAVADSPDGPFARISDQPVLEVSQDTAAFDSYRVDDASLLVKDGKFWMYYKGRSRMHGESGPRHTQMGVAIADSPAGPYQKYNNPLLDQSHEVLVWNHQDGVAALASISSSLVFAADGLNFSATDSNIKKVENRPSAPGLYRPHLTDHVKKSIPGWGIAMEQAEGYVHLVRFEMKVITKAN